MDLDHCLHHCSCKLSTSKKPLASKQTYYCLWLAFDHSTRIKQGNFVQRRWICLILWVFIFNSFLLFSRIFLECTVHGGEECKESDQSLTAHYFICQGRCNIPPAKDINPSFPKYQSKQECIGASWKQQSITWQTAEHSTTHLINQMHKNQTHKKGHTGSGEQEWGINNTHRKIHDLQRSNSPNVEPHKWPEYWLSLMIIICFALHNRYIHTQIQKEKNPWLRFCMSI